MTVNSTNKIIFNYYDVADDHLSSSVVSRSAMTAAATVTAVRIEAAGRRAVPWDTEVLLTNGSTLVRL